MSLNEEIGERIRKRRIELNLTQLELAQLLGIKNRSTITKYEQGYKTFKQSQLIKLSKALQTTPSYLLGWEEKNKFNLYFIEISKIINQLTDESKTELLNYANYLLEKENKK